LGISRRRNSRGPIEADTAQGARRRERLLPSVLFLASLALYVRTLAPSVVDIFSDTLEFQLVGPTLGIAHETGYPFYTLLSWLFAKVIPLGDAAFRINLLSALCAALAVTLIYRVALALTGRRWAAVCGALLFALSPVWWSQAIVAEVYALHGFFVAALLWLALRWERLRLRSPSAEPGIKQSDSPLLLVPAVFGLALTHHRLTLLLAPALVVFVLWTEPRLLRQPRRWPGYAVALMAPLVLYAYIPLRALATTSLDGRYQNTWQGFWRWVTASQYGAFLTGDPLSVQRSAATYIRLFAAQFGWTGLVLGVIGLVALFSNRRRWALVVLALAPSLAFAFLYRTADVEVFFIPAFLLWSLLIAAGLGGLLQQAARRTPRGARPWVSLLLVALCLGEPLHLARSNMPLLDRSDDWAVHDYGRDMLQQPLPQRASIVGLLGETTLLRYFQEVAGLRPDVHVVAADCEAGRHAAIAAAHEANQPVFITRPLPGAPERYSLSALGPLIRVWPKGQAQQQEPEHLVHTPVTSAVELVGYGMQIVETHAAPVMRVTLFWKPLVQLGDDLKASVRLLDAQEAVVAAADDVPVHNTYPTWAWQPGETVVDSYDLAMSPPVAAGPHQLIVILYRAADASEVGSLRLGQVALP
jgi:hypothetical protein